MSEEVRYARDVILNRLIAEFGLWSTSTKKVLRWSLIPDILDVVLLEADCGTIIIPWDEGRDARPYFGKVSHACFKDGRALQEGRSSNIASYTPSLGWDKDILYLSPMTSWELDRTVEFVNRKKHGIPLCQLGAPDPDSPLLGLGARYPKGAGGSRGPVPFTSVRAVFDRDAGRCVWCGSTARLHIDHIVPRAKGGGDSLENLQLLCERCNVAKSDRI